MKSLSLIHFHCISQSLKDLGFNSLFPVLFIKVINYLLESTGGPRYMRQIGTPKIDSHIMNLYIKRPRMTVYQRIGSRKRPFLDRKYVKSQIKSPHITRATCNRKMSLKLSCNTLFTLAENAGVFRTRCQFHQHFYIIFRTNVVLLHTCNQKKLPKRRSYKKRARIRRMKLTAARPNKDSFFKPR